MVISWPRSGKSLDQDRLVNAQREVHCQVEALVATLTPREREIFAFVASGLANKNIAANLGLSIQSIKLHRGRVMKKLQVDSLADLVRLAEKVKPVLSHR